MSRYDGLIIPRSYSEYINKTDAATLSQALQLNNALDDTPTEDSRGGVRSGGVFDALAGKQPTLTFDDVPTDASDNPVKSNGIYDALAGKQDTLTFDNAPATSSNNPVKSDGIAGALNDLFKVVASENKSFTIPGNTQIQLNSIGITIPNGYKAITITEFDIAGVSGAVFLYAVSINGMYGKTGVQEFSLWLKNATSSQVSGTIKAGVLCQKVF